MLKNEWGEIVETMLPQLLEIFTQSKYTAKFTATEESKSDKELFKREIIKAKEQGQAGMDMYIKRWNEVLELEMIEEIPEKFTQMPEECLHWIRKVGQELAKAEALRCYEEENRKTVLAALKLSQNVKSDAASETKARASDEWQQYLSEYQEVILQERQLRHAMNWLHNKLLAWQTKSANERREFKSYGN